MHVAVALNCARYHFAHILRGIYADGNMVIILFDAAATTRDGQPYRNTCTWYFQLAEGRALDVIAFFGTRECDEFWTRVSPTP